MNPKSYVSLHVHTTFSLLDGISRREDLVKKAKEFGMPALAITEHGNLFNAISFYKQCTDANIQPILGMEAYMAPDSRFGRTYAKKGEAQEDAKNGDLSSAYYHLTLIAKNRAGYENLKQLSSLAYREGFYYKPRIDDEILTKYKDGLIVLSGCLASRTSRLIVAGNQAKALEEIDRMRGLFGEDFYLEVMDHNIEEEEIVRNALINFGKMRGIGIVMTGDSHYTEHSDSSAHEIALAIGTGKNIQSAERWTFPGSGYWFKSPQEMYAAAEAADIPEHALTTTLDITKRIEDYGFSLVSKTKKSIIPSYRDELGNVIGNQTCHELLHFKAIQGLCTRGLGESKPHQERLAFELDMIRRKDFSSYFLIIADIVENAMRRKGIITPIGRGSSMGSLVCYCTYITGLDPIEHNLPFSRFINEGRKDLPDIDTDISKERRKEVIEYIVNKYGKDRVAQIVTFQSMAAKAVADDVGRGLGVPSSIRKSLGKLLGDLTKDDRLEEVLDGNKAARELMSQTPDWIDNAKRLEGNNRNLGEHAAGIVISNDPIINHVPLLRDSKDGYLVTQYDMRDLGELGLLKLDMLGLRTLDLIQKTVDLINERHGQVIDDYQRIPLNDTATYATVAEAQIRLSLSI
jgi:DNA polymerase-3 subunit alpha